MQPRRGPAKQRPGVALGVLGIMMLVFTSLVFMMGRPTYTSLYEDITHRVEPFSHNFHERFERMEHDLEQKLDTLGGVLSAAGSRCTAHHFMHRTCMILQMCQSPYYCSGMLSSKLTQRMET
jgi:hypothetical protein